MSDLTRFILIETSHPGNVGATARAMKVMGFTDLALVRPRYPNVLRLKETISRASGALDILENARIVDRLEDALDGVQTLCATAMTPRDFGPPTQAPRTWLPQLKATGQSVGFLFGTERFGMSNEDVYRCHTVLNIPTAPDYGSLNLAQAVQVIAYEWRQALGGFQETVSAKTLPKVDVADARAVQGLLAHWEDALVHIGFLDPAAPKKLMPRLNQLLNRAALAPEEIHILRGMAKAMLKLG
jgi:tRNA/rRNA methyltransferase